MREVLAEGLLNHSKEYYQIVCCQESNLDQVIRLQNLVLSYQSRPDELVPLSEGELMSVLGDRGDCIGILVNEQLVGFHAMLFPQEWDEENLGFDLGLGTIERRSVAHLESVFVHPLYRGQGFQKSMATWLIDRMKERKIYRYVCETIAPSNLASVKSALTVGLHIRLLKQKYGGLMRYILFQDVLSPVQLDMSTRKKVLSTDYVGQDQLLSQGYKGFSLDRQGTETIISFARQAGR